MKKFDKPPKSVDEHINLLEQRGLVFQDKSRARRYLTHVLYYRLSGYFIPYQEEGRTNHRFFSGTTFDDILQLYIFDRKLRLLMMDAVDRIEISFKSSVINEISLAYGSHWYMDKHLFHHSYDHDGLIEFIIERTGRDKSVQNDMTFRHYYGAYNEPGLPPVWSVVEILTFGQFSILFEKFMEKGLKRKIAKGYNLGYKDLTSWMHALAYIRNICAHHSRLWNKNCV